MQDEFQHEVDTPNAQSRADGLLEWDSMEGVSGMKSEPAPNVDAEESWEIMAIDDTHQQVHTTSKGSRAMSSTLRARKFPERPRTHREVTSLITSLRNVVANQGQEIEEIKASQNALRKQNSALKEEIAALWSELDKQRTTKHEHNPPGVNVDHSNVVSHQKNKSPLASITHSCLYCRKIVVNEDFDFDMCNEENEWLNIRLGVSLLDLIEAANRDCDLAQYLLKNAKTPQTAEFPEKLVLCAHFMSHEDNGWHHPDAIFPLGFWNTETEVVEEMLLPAFGVCTPSGNCVDRRIVTRPINNKTFSKESSQLFREWLTECLEYHEDCNAVRADTMPTRLIEISKESGNWKLRVRCDLDECLPYTALSYFWGPLQDTTIKTTRATISEWTVDLPWSRLPKTIQDAITVSFELGMQFLWVDAFCIIQDDEQDVEKEISLMPQIYGKATVTIAAARAENVHEGFLHDRIVTENVDKVFEVPFRCPNRQMGTVLLVEACRMYLEEPLDTRGWEMQERLLSRRVLEFGTRQTRWSCCTNVEGYSDGWTPHVEQSVERPESLHTEVLLSRADVSGPHSQSDLDELCSNWHGLVTSYTNRRLTIESDRILAISGLAEKFSAVFPGQYLAGLWSYFLPFDLLWHIREPSPEEKPMKYQAPSWSWAAVNGPVSFDYDWREGKRLHSRVRIISTDIHLRNDSAPFGAVTHGSLTLAGRVQPAEWKQERHIHGVHGDRIRLQGVEGPSGLLALRVQSDTLENESVRSMWTPIFLLYLVGRPRREPNEYWGLVLTHRENDVYSRIGIFSFRQKYSPAYCRGETEDVWLERFAFQSTWFDDCKESVISLV